MSPSPLNAPPMGPQLYQPPFPPPLYEQQSFVGHGRLDYDQSSGPFKGLSGTLPSDDALELNNVLNSLSGTKESIKGAKIWFMQRSPFAPALAEALRDRMQSCKVASIFNLGLSLMCSLQRRSNPHELDNEALAFKPVLGSMLARIFHNPHNKEENQSRLQKILQFWASKEAYDHETIGVFENEMLGGPSKNFFFRAYKGFICWFD
ncbi:hypothetical protein Vadar_009966 [Vaccinium darrowii]|uniref:Uncharacterized protein n=1 Tax=Vaccinium darrowii TaxID=229202 RepID=A0ACB7XHM6_9ERIC|nr:hypothetical protein Vadar_009966 [Vaccinium darrowii]